jgi:sialate O-acetylesterase
MKKIFLLRNSYLLAGFLAWAAFQTACSQVRLPHLVSDGMVLQRDVSVKVWGWATVAENVMVTFRGKSFPSVAGSDGKWMVMLPAMQAGGPFSMEITASNHISIENILIGDVWVCSGQSNMVLPMERVKELYAGVISNSDNPYIRHFFVPNRYDFNTPQHDLPSGKWESANPESVLRFTATGYFFARALYEKYHIPIGLINASVGGTPLEAWLSEDALKAFPKYSDAARICSDSNYVNAIREEEQRVSNAWYGYIGKHDMGWKSEKPWFDTLYDASSWSKIHLPAFWAEEGLKDTNGIVWFRKEVNIPPSMIGKPAKLLLGRIVDWDTVYINGSFVGTVTYQYPPRKYEIRPDLIKAGKNVIVIKVISNSGQGGFIKDKPYQLIAGGQTIDLSGEWQYRSGVATGPLPAPTFFQYKPLGLFNGMIAPLLNYPIKGVIWYQGESNTSRSSEYYALFSALINDWRQKWNLGSFPFLYVQLANFMQSKNQPAESEWAALREAQLLTLAVPNTGMAVISDIGEWNDIHPLNKEDVGKRLALLAEKLGYGEKGVVYSGPIYHSMKIKGNKVVISFTNTGSGLFVKGGGELKHFAIAGADKKFVWANARIAGNKVIVWNDIISQPVAVRYGWADNPESANLYNKEGLPASPFRTDK